MAKKKPIIGVFALQGAVEPHRPHIEACGAEFRAVKTEEELNAVDALILPGGESTTMLKLIEHFKLWDVLANVFKVKPVWGICAGCILIAGKVENPTQQSFNLLPIAVQRNGYGRQIDSYYSDIQKYRVSFIRAPIITYVEKGTEVLAKVDDHPVWLRHGKVMATTFHPELTLDFPSPMHKTFVEMI